MKQRYHHITAGRGLPAELLLNKRLLCLRYLSPHQRPQFLARVSANSTDKYPGFSPLVEYDLTDTGSSLRLLERQA